jgi:hypothetical protein
MEYCRGYNCDVSDSVWCSPDRWPVPGSQSTAAETNEHDNVNSYNALITPFVAVLTERPVLPREPARTRPAKKGCGNKPTRKALLITDELVKIECKAARSYAKKWRQASSLVSPFLPASVGQAKHGRRNIRK